MVQNTLADWYLSMGHKEEDIPESYYTIRGEERDGQFVAEKGAVIRLHLRNKSGHTMGRAKLKLHTEKERTFGAGEKTTNGKFMFGSKSN